jgi:hypothetical protein
MRTKNINRMLRLCIVAAVAYLLIMTISSMLKLSAINLVFAVPGMIAFLLPLHILGVDIFGGFLKLIKKTAIFVLGKDEKEKKQVSKT